MYSRHIHNGVLIHEHLPPEYLFVDTFPCTGLDVLDLLRDDPYEIILEVDPFNKVVKLNGATVPPDYIRNVLADTFHKHSITVSSGNVPDFRNVGTELCGVVVKFIYSGFFPETGVCMYIEDHSTLCTTLLDTTSIV